MSLCQELCQILRAKIETWEWKTIVIIKKLGNKVKIEKKFSGINHVIINSSYYFNFQWFECFSYYCLLSTPTVLDEWTNVEQRFHTAALYLFRAPLGFLTALIFSKLCGTCSSLTTQNIPTSRKLLDFQVGSTFYPQDDQYYGLCEQPSAEVRCPDKCISRLGNCNFNESQFGYFRLPVHMFNFDTLYCWKVICGYRWASVWGMAAKTSNTYFSSLASLAPNWSNLRQKNQHHQTI